ncbi:MAG: helix-turn-helix transcriptional regulator [Oscillospiraceae bacterium]|nr:helix-turn-helix transcriptional regulator [Oscillospiraceae bacterium]
MKFLDFAGNKIRSIRKRKKIKTSELANVCGVSESEMRHLENGTRIITEAQIEKVAERLQVSPAALRSRGIVDYSDIMHILFEISSIAGISPFVTEDGTYLKVEDPALISAICAWKEIEDKLQNQEISPKEWLSWLDNFPYSMENYPPLHPYSEPLPAPDEIIGVDLVFRELSPDEMDEFANYEDVGVNINYDDSDD